MNKSESNHTNENQTEIPDKSAYVGCGKSVLLAASYSTGTGLCQELSDKDSGKVEGEERRGTANTSGKTVCQKDAVQARVADTQ